MPIHRVRCAKDERIADNAAPLLIQQEALGGHPEGFDPEQPGRLGEELRVTTCVDDVAVGGHQTGFPDNGVAAGGAQAGRFEIRPGLFRTVAADLLDLEAVALGQRHRHAGFDLRSKTGKNSEGSSDERGSGHCRNCLDHDGPQVIGPFSAPRLMVKK